MQNKELKSEITLEIFISQNKDFFPTIGILIAAISLTNKSNNLALNIISFFSMAGLLLVGYEMYKKMQGALALQLKLFKFILIFIGTGFTTYWIYEFRSFWNIFLWLPTFSAILFYAFWKLLPIARQYRITRKLFGIDNQIKTWYQKLFRGSVLLTIVYFSLMYGFAVALVINTIFNNIKSVTANL